MKIILALTVLLAAAVSYSISAHPGSDDEFGGKLTDYRIKDAHTILVRCDAVRILTLNATKVELFRIKDEIVVNPSVAQTSARYDSGSANGTDPSFLEFTFSQYSFEPGEDYELRFSGVYQNGTGGVDIKFKSALLRFSTASNFAVVPNLGQQTFRLFSRVALGTFTNARLVEKSTNRTFGLQAAGSQNDFDTMGNALIVPAPNSIDPRQLAVSGISDIFGNTPGVKPAKPIAPPSAPKDKDASAWYFNFLHQAGVGAKPTWIVNAKIAPLFGGLPGGYFLAPSLDVDIGQGQVGKTKTNDIINPKIGITRLVRTRAGVLENLQFTPAFSYETNRKFHKRNAMFDGELRFYFRNFQNTRGERSLDAFLRERLKNKKILPQDVPKAFFGYSIKTFLGTEIGRALTANDVKSSDKTSQVAVPKYGIRRLRPRVSATFEFQRVTATISFVPRYLFSDENVTREVDTPQPGGKITKTIILGTVSGWRPYAEFSLSYAIDPLGHYSINTIYKRGSQPPNFDRTNTVQSGILVRF
jgi:hypothetical protein